MDKIIYLNMVEMERNHWWYKGRREIIGKIIQPFLHSNMKILDAGCGAGGTMEYMSEYGSMLGVDISKEMVEHCRNIGLNALCESIHCLPFQDHTFDLVLCLDVLEHLQDEKQVLEELNRVVKPGGILVFSVPAFSWLWGKHDELNDHYRRYNFGELKDVIERSNLRPERSTYFNFFLLPTVWVVRKVGKKIPRFAQKGTDFQFGSGVLNQLLFSILKLEQLLLQYCDLPIGVSQVIVARKN